MKWCVRMLPSEYYTTFHSNNKIHLPSLWRAIHNLQVVNTQLTIYIKTSHLTFDRRYSLQANRESLSQFLNNLVFSVSHILQQRPWDWWTANLYTNALWSTITNVLRNRYKWMTWMPENGRLIATNGTSYVHFTQSKTYINLQPGNRISTKTLSITNIPCTYIPPMQQYSTSTKCLGCTYIPQFSNYGLHRFLWKGNHGDNKLTHYQNTVIYQF
jgi:hypothetical protein